MALNLQAELGQEICALPFPQMHSCSHSAGGEPGPPLTERRELRCHWLLPAGGRDVYIPLKDMPRSFLATWWAEICHWSLPPWQSAGCKFMERPRARKWVRKQCDCWQTWRVWRCEELRGRLSSHKTRSHYPPSRWEKAQQDPRGAWRISQGLGLLGHIWEAYFPLCDILEESLQAATVSGAIHSPQPLCSAEVWPLGELAGPVVLVLRPPRAVKMNKQNLQKSSSLYWNKFFSSL